MTVLCSACSQFEQSNFSVKVPSSTLYFEHFYQYKDFPYWAFWKLACCRVCDNWLTACWYIHDQHAVTLQSPKISVLDWRTRFRSLPNHPRAFWLFLAGLTIQLFYHPIIIIEILYHICPNHLFFVVLLFCFTTDISFHRCLLLA